MTTEVALRTDLTTVELAEKLAGATMVPRQYQQNPANLLFAFEYADALGIPRINALTTIHVIEGKPSASADLIGALVRKAGHRLRVSGDDTYATAQIIRADDPDYTHEVTWDMDRAKRAKLTGKDNWQKYPAAMLRARAITEVARMAASEALHGVIYTPEELGAVVDEDGLPVAGANPNPVRQRPAPAPQPGQSKIAAARAAQAGRPAPEPAPSAPTPAEAPEEAQGEPHVDQQTWVNLSAALKAVGVEGSAQQLDAVSRLVGRQISRGSELTMAEAHQVIRDLHEPAPEAPASEDVVDAEVVDEAPAA